MAPGCSQRYPHPGYAQNYTVWCSEPDHQPVDRNGDRLRRRDALGENAAATRAVRDRFLCRIRISRAGRTGVARIGLGELSTRIHMKVRTSPIRMMACRCRGGQDTCLVNESASCRSRVIPNGRPQGGSPRIGLWIIRFHNIYGRLDWSRAAEFPGSFRAESRRWVFENPWGIESPILSTKFSTDFGGNVVPR